MLLLLLFGCGEAIERPRPQLAVFDASPLCPPAALPEEVPYLAPGERWIPGAWVATDQGWFWAAGRVATE